MKRRVLLASTLSLILVVVVAVTVAIVAVVHSHGMRMNSNDHSNNIDELRIHKKAVKALCEGTDDLKLCHDLLYPVKTSNPKDYIDTVVNTSMESVIKAFNMTQKLRVEHGERSNNDPGIKMALEDCNDMLQSAIDELQEASRAFVNTTIHDIHHHRSAELKNLLGAVIAYQQTCLDGFNTESEKKVQSKLQKAGSLNYVGKLTGLALDLVSALSGVLHFSSPSSHHNNNTKLNFSRSLLDDVDDRDGYPNWFSVSDRMLLGRHKRCEVLADAVVAKDGSGNFTTVADAINAYPKNLHRGRYVIYVKRGVYEEEYITVDKKKPNIFMYGDGPTNTIITGRKNFREGTKTLRTATFAAAAEGFIAKGIAFENTAGPKGNQAVALRVQGDRSAFFQCAIHGYQDTLYVHAHRQLYRDCEISGTVDFIFGYSSTLIQKSKITLRKPNPGQKNTVVADGTDQKSMPTGIVLQNCLILPEVHLFPHRLAVKSYLARPWKAFSRAVFIENVIGDLIQPEGYIPWAPDTPNTENSYFAEFGNLGAGAGVEGRVNWAKGIFIHKDEAAQFTAEKFLQANTWLPHTGIPFDNGFTMAHI